MPQELRVGFIGLGTMGKPMTANLIKNGFKVSVYDVDPRPAAELARDGATPCASAREVAASADVVITMLPNSAIVEQALLGPAGVAEGARPGLVVVDMSTVAPAMTERVAKALAARGVQLLDAPVSRGRKAAIDGTLIIMASGDAAAYQKALPVLKGMGTDIIYAGPTGQGIRIKLVNNLVTGITLCAIGECLVFGTRAGAAPGDLAAALVKDTSTCWLLETKLPNTFLAGKFEPSFKANLAKKDLGLAIEMAGQVDYPVFLGTQAFNEYLALDAAGRGEEDSSAPVRIFEGMAGVEVRAGRPASGSPAEASRAIKLTNSILTAVLMCAYAEALVLGARVGVKASVMLDTLKLCSSNSWIIENRAAGSILAGDFKPGIKAQDLRQDLAAAMDLAAGFKLALPLTGLASNFYSLLAGQGKAGLDFSAVITLWEGWAGVQFRA